MATTCCTTTFFLIPKNVTSERSIALVPTLILWLEWLRAPEVSQWQDRHRVGWGRADRLGHVARVLSGPFSHLFGLA